ncbi:hypothetical protein FA13DRAFT_1896433, partial [Coprinellus micaceus]
IRRTIRRAFRALFQYNETHHRRRSRRTKLNAGWTMGTYIKDSPQAYITIPLCCEVTDPTSSALPGPSARSASILLQPRIIHGDGFGDTSLRLHQTTPIPDEIAVRPQQQQLYAATAQYPRAIQMSVDEPHRVDMGGSCMPARETAQRVKRTSMGVHVKKNRAASADYCRGTAVDVQYGNKSVEAWMVERLGSGRRQLLTASVRDRFTCEKVAGDEELGGFK